MAEKIINSSHAGVTKRLAQDIHSEESLSKHEVEIMECVLIEKAEQIPEFKDALIETGTTTIVHPVSSKLWGTGLSFFLTKVTKKEAWPGQNLFGTILENVRSLYGTQIESEIQKLESHCILQDKNPYQALADYSSVTTESPKRKLANRSPAQVSDHKPASKYRKTYSYGSHVSFHEDESEQEYY